MLHASGSREEQLPFAVLNDPDRRVPFAVLNDPDRRVGIELGMSALDGERYVKDPSDGKRPAVVIDEHSVICEWESDMNHTDQIAKLLERL